MVGGDGVGRVKTTGELQPLPNKVKNMQFDLMVYYIDLVKETREVVFKGICL